MKQKHEGEGDNVGQNKYETNFNFEPDNLSNKINSRLQQIKSSNEWDLKDDTVTQALKEIIKELIEEEQQKSHQMVPIGKIWDRFQSLFDEDNFIVLIDELIKEESIELEDTQVCFITKKTKFKINL